MGSAKAARYPQAFLATKWNLVDRIYSAGYAEMVTNVESHPFIRLRGRSFMALVLAPDLPLADWLAALDAQIERSPSFFEGRPVVVDLATLPREQPDVAGLLRGLERRGIHIIGTEGAHPSWPDIETWGRPLPNAGKAGKLIEVPSETPRAAVAETTSGEPNSLIIDEPVRSGQSVVFERGDVTILGSVASGAEVMAGGSVHIYGTLRGRAIAGLSGNSRARVFCRKLQAELVAIDGVYQTADDMPAGLIGRPVQAWLDGEQMKMTALD
jgi:septum site-determining protein MinC